MNGFQESPMYEDAHIVNPITLIGQKKCTKCKILKPFCEFYKDNAIKSTGLSSHCKDCKAKHRKTLKGKAISRKYGCSAKGKITIKRARMVYNQSENGKHVKKRYAQSYAGKASVRKYDQSDKGKATGKRYRRTPKGRATYQKSCHNRRARILGVRIENFNLVDVLRRDNYICQLCGKKTRPDFKNPFHPLYPNVDHIVPLSQGGEHSKLNTQCLCHKCNIEKNSTGKGDQLRMFG